MKLQNMKALYDELRNRFADLEKAAQVPRQVFVAKEVEIEAPTVAPRIASQIEEAFNLREQTVQRRNQYLLFKILQQNALLSKQDRLLSKCTERSHLRHEDCRPTRRRLPNQAEGHFLPCRAPSAVVLVRTLPTQHRHCC